MHINKNKDEISKNKINSVKYQKKLLEGKIISIHYPHQSNAQLFLVWSGLTIKTGDVGSDSISIAKQIISGILSPDWHFSFRLDAKGVLYLLFETICIAFFRHDNWGKFFYSLCFFIGEKNSSHICGLVW